MLYYHVKRLSWSAIPLYVATTVNNEDDCLVDFCNEMSLPYFRGSESNVLERYYQCATENELDIIARVTSDCPLLDGHIIRDAVDRYRQENDPNVYLSNYLERCYPRGFDFEVFSFQSLKEAYENAVKESHLEHVTPYINQNISGKIRFLNYTRKYDDSKYRITVDTLDDFRLIREMIEKFNCHEVGAENIIKVLRDNPYLNDFNSHVLQKTVD
ncbi:MAG: hypothetical protein KAR13_13245, partial [Desulfobulbaceae bacterium]|nr:hypothetical protein [Desulfobulbaceae bacterium]